LKKLYQSLKDGLRPRIDSLSYELGQCLGTGSFASVFLAQNLKGEQFSVKKIQRNQRNYQLHRFREIEAGTRLKHRGIPRLIEFYEDDQFGYLVFEYVKGSDLLEFLEMQSFGGLSDGVIHHIFSQLVSIVGYIHQQGVYHRDIKLENILICSDLQGTIKLIDFGLSIISCSRAPNFFCNDLVGSIEYCAPEILLGQSYTGESVDVYAMGVVLFTLFFGELPFSDPHRREFMKGIRSHPQLVWKDGEISEDAKDLLKKMLAFDPKERVSIEEVRDHKWMQQ